MSLIYNNRDYYLIDHRDFVTKVYNNIIDKQTAISSVTFLAKLFSIIKIENNISSRKRTRNSDSLNEETLKIKGIYERLIHEVPSDIKVNLIKKYKVLNTSDVRDISKQFFESTNFDFDDVNGGNNSNVPLKCVVKDNCFLLPANSRFYCGCVKEKCEKLSGNKFDLIIADPPWWNKYIRRLKSANDKLSYSMMYNEDIAAIPVKELLAENCLVAVWCTNAPSNIAAVKNIIFPKWGVEYVATWYWLKVTVDLHPLCEFSAGCKKQPYERIIFGKVGDIKEIPDNQVVVSVPSALHSHKPPLLDILTQFLNVENPQTLELFARYLLPNTTSIGYEPLKWQHHTLYEEVS